jgi:hypothetical protein
MTELAVTSAVLSDEVRRRAIAMANDIIVLPSGDADGSGLYTEPSVGLVKELRACSVDAAYLDPAEARAFEVKKSALTEAAISLSIGIASSAAWEGLKAILARKKATRLDVTFLDVQVGSRTHGQAWRACGGTDEVLAAIDRLRQLTALDLPDDEGSVRSAIRSNGFPSDGSDDDIRARYMATRVYERWSEAGTLLEHAKRAVATANDSYDYDNGEAVARQALTLLRGALDWAEDTEREDAAHLKLDKAGTWVRETYGCQFSRDGDSYLQTCPVALGHNRIGMSMGGYARVRICSLCGLDLSECEHLQGTAYLVPGGPGDLGWCRVCLGATCDHDPSSTYRVSVVAKVNEFKFDEVSLVSKPAQPEARFLAVSISHDELREGLGPAFVPGMEVNCDYCLDPCGGLIRHSFPQS